MVEYTNAGEYIKTYWMPTDDNLNGAVKSGQYADGYDYDIRALPRRNVLVTSSFTGWNNYMMDLGKLMGDAEAMTHFGNTVVIWDLHTRQPKKYWMYQVLLWKCVVPGRRTMTIVSPRQL